MVLVSMIGNHEVKKINLIKHLKNYSFKIIVNYSSSIDFVTLYFPRIIKRDHEQVFNLLSLTILLITV